MKRTFIITGIVVGVAIIIMILFNRLASDNDSTNLFEEAKKGTFEISITAAGELIAENSLEVFAPAIGLSTNRGGGGPGQQGRGGGIRVMDFKILDIVPEGTVVNKGDYIAQLDKTSYDNTLKDALENLTTLQTAVQMKILDTTMTLTALRDDIKNQRFIVEEAEITLAQSKFEPPATIRQAEMNLDKAQRGLEQLIKSYDLRVAQSLTDIRHEKMHLNQGQQLVNDLQEFLSKFTITAPTEGMVIYKKDWSGNKRKAGSSINPFDRVVVTLPDLSSMISKIFVGEIEVSKVATGQKVNINVDALPDKALTGEVISVANIGEQLPNSDAKMFEVMIRVEGSDPVLRPSMTTGNKIIIKTFDNVVYIPTECVQTGADSIPYVLGKNKTRQIVVLGEANEENVIVEQGLEPSTSVYIAPPENAESFRTSGEDLIPIIRERVKAKKVISSNFQN